MASEIELLSGQRQKSESSKAVQACNDWLRLGPSRSLSFLLRQYRDTPQNAATLSLYTLQAWSKSLDWDKRAESYDAQLEQKKNERAKEIMQSGLSLAHERVVALKKMFAFLEEQIYEQGEGGTFHNVWVPDVKQIGSGEDAERVDIERFNSAIFEQARGVLDDLAKETGGRVQKNDLTSGGEVIKVIGVDLGKL